MGAGGVLPVLLRGGFRRTALPGVPLPVHRALGRGRYPLFLGRRAIEDRARGVVDGNPRLRDGASEGAGGGGRQPRRLAGLCVRHGHRPAGDAEIRDSRSQGVLRERSSVAEALWVRGAGHADGGRGVEPLMLWFFTAIGGLLISALSFLMGSMFAQSEAILAEKRRIYEEFLRACPKPSDAYAEAAEGNSDARFERMGEVQ